MLFGHRLPHRLQRLGGVQRRQALSRDLADDHELLAPSEVEGSVPRLGILVSIEEAYSQCSKALIRSDLWNPERHIERSALPSSGEILRSLNDPAFDATEYDEARAERYARREGLY